MAKKNYTALVLDSSGSMASILEEALSGFNEHLQKAKVASLNLDTRLVMTMFSEKVNVVHFNVDPKTVKPLDKGTYIPDTTTAMYDAVGETITRMSANIPDINDEGVSVLVVIVSDGMENASKRFNSEQLSELIKAKQATGRWTFAYVGANQDLTKVQKNLGIAVGNMLSFTATRKGTKSMKDVSSRGISTYYETMVTTGDTGVIDMYGSGVTKVEEDGSVSQVGANA